jgi:sugar/nucleoside kinase (ribokinase family)
MSTRRPSSSDRDRPDGGDIGAPSFIAGIGEILWDILPDGRQLGGAPANFAYHARALSASSVIVSAVGDDEPGRAILAELSRRGLDHSEIALTKGPAGSRLFGRDVDLSHKGYPVETADTVGAGDAFTAALVTGILRQKSWDEIGERANRVAGYVCSRKGAWPELPSELASWDRP